MIQIVNIILVIIGTGLMFTKKISISAQSEIRRPQTYIFGGLIVILVLLANFVSGMFEHSAEEGYFSTGWLLSYIIPLILIFVSIPFLKQPKAVSGDSEDVAIAKSGADKVANIITWVIFGAIGVGLLYFAFTMLQKSEQPNSPQTNNTQNPTPTPTPNPTSTNPTANWQSYSNSQTGLSFKYPNTWTLNNYDKSPNLLVYSELIGNLSTQCGELGTCQQYELDNKKVIENDSMSGIISFDGGKGSLIATCSANEGGDLVPTPFYKFKFFKGDRLYEITLNDLPTKLSANSDCNSSKYIQDVVKAIPSPISDSKYKTYNDLLTLIEESLVLK